MDVVVPNTCNWWHVGHHPCPALVCGVINLCRDVCGVWSSRCCPQVLVQGTNFHGQLGLGHARCIPSAVQVPFFRSESLTVTKLSCGQCHTAFLVAPGRLFMAGWYGPFRAMAESPLRTPLFGVCTLIAIVPVLLSPLFWPAATCMRVADVGRACFVRPWFDNRHCLLSHRSGEYGRLGLGTTADAWTPQEVVIVPQARCGIRHTISPLFTPLLPA